MGPDQGSKPTYVLLEDWVKIGEALRREAALERLARRYMAAYGPAAPQDFAAWSGLAAKDCQAAFEAIRDSLHETDADGTKLWMPEDQRKWLDSSDNEPVVRLLGAFDTYVLGYASRDMMIEAQYAKRVNAGGGMIRPTLLVEGQIAGVWKMEQIRGQTTILLQPFEALRKDIMSALEQEAEDIGRFLNRDITLSAAR